jgi:predicted nucleic acid-binding protein
MLVIDTSAFISLAVGDVLDDMLTEYSVVTTTLVIEELESTAKYDDVHGHGATAVLERSDRFDVLATSSPEFSSNRIDAGEVSCDAAVEEIDAAFLIDDFRALPGLTTLVSADVALSPILLRVLVKRGVLTDSDAGSALDTIARDRDWLGAPIYRYAQRLFKESGTNSPEDDY